MTGESAHSGECKHSPVSRVTRSKAEAKASYNRLSGWYDALAGSSERRYTTAGLQKLAVQPGERVLEIGFGTGHALLALARAVGESGKVYGVDLSEGMLRIAQERIRAAGLADRIKLWVGDGAQTTSDGAYNPCGADHPGGDRGASGDQPVLLPNNLDAIFMSFTLELFDTPEIPQVLAFCRARLRAGGRLGLVALVKPNRDNLAVRIYERCHARWPAAVDCRPIPAQAALQEAGFELQSVTSYILWGLPVEVILAAKP